MSRLILSEILNFPKKHFTLSLLLALSFFVTGTVLTEMDVGLIWVYVGVANKATAVVMLWSASAELMRKNKFYWIGVISAMLMTIMLIASMFNSKTFGLGLPTDISIVSGVMITILLLFFIKSRFSSATSKAPKNRA